MTDESAPPDDGPHVGIDRLHADAAIYQAFAPGPLEFARGEDGLPTVKPTDLPIVPPLSIHTFVCMADRSVFVVRDPIWGEILARFTPEEVSRAPNGDYYVPRALYELRVWQGPKWIQLYRLQGQVLFWTSGSQHPEHPSVEFLPTDEALHHAGPPQTVAVADYFNRVYPTERQPVEPIRPQCAHYRRQMTDFQDAASHQFIERLCTARRDNDSFFLSVRDQQVHACELRAPRALETEARLDRFDDAKAKLGKERYQEGGEFDVDAALTKTEQGADRGLAFGGIFKE